MSQNATSNEDRLDDHDNQLDKSWKPSVKFAPLQPLHGSRSIFGRVTRNDGGRMSVYHQQLAAGRWQQFSLVTQLANIGSEVERAIKWKREGNDEYF